MRILSFIFFIAFSCFSAAQNMEPISNAHAHNDYKHERPLLDALQYGFTSVEADVFLIRDTFFVYHNLPLKPDPTRTLEHLYLKPLKDRVDTYGHVYPAYEGAFYLMIDIKSNGEKAFQPLQDLLNKYNAYLNDNTEVTEKPIKVFISGNRPYEEILSDSTLLFALDGRPDDLGQHIPTSFMPVVSTHYKKVYKWKKKGEISKKHKKALQTLVQTAHDEGKKVRLWAVPDHPKSWAFLQVNAVDLINTDDLHGLQQFLTQKNKN